MHIAVDVCEPLRWRDQGKSRRKHNDGIEVPITPFNSFSRKSATGFIGYAIIAKRDMETLSKCFITAGSC